MERLREGGGGRGYERIHNNGNALNTAASMKVLQNGQVVGLQNDFGGKARFKPTCDKFGTGFYVVFWRPRASREIQTSL